MQILSTDAGELPRAQPPGRRRFGLLLLAWMAGLLVPLLGQFAANADDTPSWVQPRMRRLPPVVGIDALNEQPHQSEPAQSAVRLASVVSTDASVYHAPRRPTSMSRSLFDSEVQPSSYMVGSGPILAPGKNAAPWDAEMAARATDEWKFQVLPDGLIYRSYLAGAKEPRFASQWVYEQNQGWIWDIALGGRVGILRCGTDDARWPQGWQADIEGAAFPRLDLEDERDLMAADFRFGIPLTYGAGRFQTKIGYYHLSSHLGDELMIKHPSVPRINYSRDVIVWGNSFYWTKDLRLYAEAAYAFYRSGGSEPWEFQFGIDYSPAQPSHWRGAPFVAINGHLREELDFGGNVVVQTGWQWRGVTGHLFRVGMHYYAGASEQFEFFRQYEDKIGLGVWYDY